MRDAARAVVRAAVADGNHPFRHMSAVDVGNGGNFLAEL